MFDVADVDDDEVESESVPLLPLHSPRSQRKFDSVRSLLEKVKFFQAIFKNVVFSNRLKIVFKFYPIARYLKFL